MSFRRIVALKYVTDSANKTVFSPSQSHTPMPSRIPAPLSYISQIPAAIHINPEKSSFLRPSSSFDSDMVLRSTPFLLAFLGRRKESGAVTLSRADAQCERARDQAAERRGGEAVTRREDLQCERQWHAYLPPLSVDVPSLPPPLSTFLPSPARSSDRFIIRDATGPGWHSCTD